MRKPLFLFLLLPFLLTACGDSQPAGPEMTGDVLPDMMAALDSVGIRAKLQHLSSDEMAGRAPGTPGEDLAVEYIAEQMRAAGLEPAVGGSFFQEVALVSATPAPRGPLTLRAHDGETVALDFVDDFIASTDLTDESVETEGQLVFVGYGIDAPEENWHAFKDVDVTDKILVSFVNDPIAGDEEPNLFQGDTLTYYGRWTYKYEEARRRGAKGVLLIHTLGTAGYPFTVLSGGARSPQIQLATPPENPLAMKGWITRETAEQLAQMAGTTLDEWFAAANDRDFEPQVLPITASYDADYTVREFAGRNVIGKITGRTNPDEAIIYTAHHDHLGIATPVEGDSIYNGAVDNASGVAMLLELAEAFAAAPTKPARTVLFASVTAEESGLLGAEFYARNPVMPMQQTVANINVDSGNIYGETDDIVGIGAERSEMLDLLREAAVEEGMTVTADPQPNQGLFFRSDQLAFARSGVPAVFIETGRTYRNQPASYYDEVQGGYNRTRYHQPSDEFDPAWSMGGLLQQTRVALRMGYRLAFQGVTPQWNEGEAFAQAR